MDQLADGEVLAGSIDNKLVEGDLCPILFSSIFAPALTSLTVFVALSFDDIVRHVVEGIRISVLTAQELIHVLLVTPDDLSAIFVWLQFPKNDLAIVFSYRDQARVILQPLDLFDGTGMAFEHTIRDL